MEKGTEYEFYCKLLFPSIAIFDLEQLHGYSHDVLNKER